MRNIDFKMSRNLVLGSILSVILVLLVLGLFPILTHHFELKMTDLKFKLRDYSNKNPDLSSDIVMINIDDYSKKQSGFDLWPYSYYAQTIEKINTGNPSSLGIDIIFTVTIDTIGWTRLLHAVEDSYVAINPYLSKFGDESIPLIVKDHSNILNELEYDNLPLLTPGLVKHVVDIPYKSKSEFIESGSLGFINIESDADGILRRLPIVAEINGMLVPHFFLRLLCEHIGYDLSNIKLFDKYKIILNDFIYNGINKDLEIPLDGRGNMLVNFMSLKDIQNLTKLDKFSSISAWDLISHPKAIDLSGKSVILGDLSAAVKDFSNTPLDSPIGNPLIYGIAFSNILNEQFIYTTSYKISILIIILSLIVLLYFSLILDVWKLGLLAIGIIISYISFDFWIFINKGFLFQTLDVLIPIVITSVFILIYSMYESQVKMGVLEGSLKSYLSPHLMDKIKNNPDMLKLGGKRKRISVLFSDIAGFTSFTDKADPAEVQNVLEEYFNEMTSIVFENNGIVDKYMGDGIMAFFENPENGVTSAQSAVKAAVDMQLKADELDEKYKKQNRFPFSVYVGIATGYAKVGNIGPPEKVDYTVIGSVVNKASRLDGPGDPGDILMDEDTYFFVKGDYDIESFGLHELKGFEKSVKIFRLSKNV